MLKVIGIVGIVLTFVAIILYSIGNLQMNKGLIQHVINTTKDPYLHFACKVNGKTIKGRAHIDISWFPFGDKEYISYFCFIVTLFRKGWIIKKREKYLIEVDGDQMDKETIESIKWK